MSGHLQQPALGHHDAEGWVIQAIGPGRVKVTGTGEVTAWAPLSFRPSVIVRGGAGIDQDLRSALRVVNSANYGHPRLLAGPKVVGTDAHVKVPTRHRLRGAYVAETGWGLGTPEGCA